MNFNYHYRSLGLNHYFSGRALKQNSKSRTDLLKDGITVVAKYDEDNKKVVCGFAVCSNKDRYSKIKGIQVAEKHLEENNPKYTFESDLDLSEVTAKSLSIEKLINKKLREQSEIYRLKGRISIENNY